MRKTRFVFGSVALAPLLFVFTTMASRDQLRFQTSVASIASVSTASKDDPVSKIIDRRTTAEINNYYLVFTARGGSASGHAFVTWGIEDHEGQQSRVQAYGLYPIGGNKGVLGEVPGEIVDEFEKQGLTEDQVRLVVKVDRVAYERAEQMRKEWADEHAEVWNRSTTFELIAQDCVTFIAAVASEVGLTVPKRDAGTLTPRRFALQLLGEND